MRDAAADPGMMRKEGRGCRGDGKAAQRGMMGDWVGMEEEGGGRRAPGLGAAAAADLGEMMRVAAGEVEWRRWGGIGAAAAGESSTVRKWDGEDELEEVGVWWFAGKLAWWHFECNDGSSLG